MKTSEYLIKKYSRNWLTKEELVAENLEDLVVAPDENGMYSVFVLEKALLKSVKRSKDAIMKEYGERLKRVFKDYAPEPTFLSKARIKELICEAYTGGYNRGLLGLKDYDLVDTLKKHGLA